MSSGPTPHNVWARPVPDQAWPGPVRPVHTQPADVYYAGPAVPRSPGMGGTATGEFATTRRSGIMRVIGWIGLAVILSLSGLIALAAITANTGAVGVLIGFLTALLPLLVVVLCLMWVDRYENEPPTMLALAFAWGASIAALVSLILNTTAQILIGEAAPDAGAVVVAPIVEESAKAAGILLVLLLRRGKFDGIVDGIVYAGFTAAGFAFTENILYFGRAYADADVTGLIWTFMFRGLVFPFAHPMFTAMTGIGIGIAVSSRSTVVRVLAPLTGLMLAMILHSLFNYVATHVTSNYDMFVLLPIFAAFAGFVLFARRREGRLIERHLMTYARFGWLTGDDVAMLSSLKRRKQALAWAARTQGADGRKAMNRFQDIAVDLAFLRERIERGTARPQAHAMEPALLNTLWQLRCRFVG